MSPIADDIREEATVLSRSIEGLLRQLIKFLLGRVSLVSLQELVRNVFVEEAENKLREEAPRKNISLTKLALLTGLDTRTLTKIRNSPDYRKPLHGKNGFLRDFTPGAYLLDVWSSRSPYMDERTGKPKILPVSGQSPSFEELFQECGKSRGVTYTSMLERLVESGSVELDSERGKVQLFSQSYLPSKSADQLDAMELGFSAIRNMVDTVTHNIEALESGAERYYQRGVWTYRLPTDRRSKLRKALHALLERTDNDAREIIERHEVSYSEGEHITAGVSLFYFEEAEDEDS